MASAKAIDRTSIVGRRYGVVALAAGLIVAVTGGLLLSLPSQSRPYSPATGGAATRARSSPSPRAQSQLPYDKIGRLLTPTPVTGRWHWDTCRVAPPLVAGEEELLVFSSVFVGRQCAGVSSRDVVPATHLTADRIPALFRLVRLWTTPRRDRLHHSGCVSISFGAPDPSALTSLREALDEAPALAAFLLVHVVVGPQVRAAECLYRSRNTVIAPPPRRSPPTPSTSTATQPLSRGTPRCSPTSRCPGCTSPPRLLLLPPHARRQGQQRGAGQGSATARRGRRRSRRAALSQTSPLRSARHSTRQPR